VQFYVQQVGRVVVRGEKIACEAFHQREHELRALVGENGRQAGSVSTGRRSTSRTRNRKERERAPTTIEARNATESGIASSMMRSTACLLERWGEIRVPADAPVNIRCEAMAGVSCPRGSGPPRYTMRLTPAARAAWANVSAEARSRAGNGSPEEGSIEWIR
jgi:hypothetical protein